MERSFVRRSYDYITRRINRRCKTIVNYRSSFVAREKMDSKKNWPDLYISQGFKGWKIVGEEKIGTGWIFEVVHDLIEICEVDLNYNFFEL